MCIIPVVRDRLMSCFPFYLLGRCSSIGEPEKKIGGSNRMQKVL